jgi:hypothetical protein
VDNKIEEIVADRQTTHGEFVENTVTMQALKDVMRATPNWNLLRPWQKEALEMNAHKIGRILHGDPNYLDHWEDMSGYNHRVIEQLRKELVK